MKFRSFLKLSYEQVGDLLRRFSQYFPSLSQRVDLDQYSHKLSDNAHFLIAYDSDEIIAFMAYYYNIEKQMAYVPLIAVDSMYRRKGIGGALLDFFNSFEAIRCVRLEVLKDNKQAYRFYSQQGFREIAAQQDKLLLEKSID